MYILFKKNESRDDSDLTSAYHEMGYTNDESSAEDWVSENPEYRYYRYCPDEIY